MHLHLRDHEFAAVCLAWSLDDTVLLSSCEQFIKMWDTEVRQVPCSQKYRCFNSHLVWCTHPNNRGPYGANLCPGLGTNLGTGLGTQWVGVYFGFRRWNDQFMGETLSSRYLLSYELYGCSGVGWKAA